MCVLKGMFPFTGALPDLLDTPKEHLALDGTCMGLATKLVLSGPSSERITKSGVMCDRPIRKFSTGPGV